MINKNIDLTKVIPNIYEAGAKSNDDVTSYDDLYSILWKVTNRCNKLCSYCPIYDNQESFHPTNKIIDYINYIS